MTLNEEHISKELQYYDLKNKVIYCINDDEHSVLYKYLCRTFATHGIKGLYATKYREPQLFDDNSILYYDGKKLHKTCINGNGRYNTADVINTIRKSDFIITAVAHPLYNLVAHLIKYGKNFLLYGDANKIMKRNMVQMLSIKTLNIGYTQRYTPHMYRWITNIDITPQPQPIPQYILSDNPEKYDNYDAVYVGNMKLVPKNYKKAMGMPLAFIDYFSPRQYKLLDIISNLKYKDEFVPPQLIVKAI